MKHLQRYFFRQIMWPFIVALAALTGLAILTQSLASISLLVDDKRGLFVFVYVTVLALPQLLSLVIPIALFIAVTYAMHRLHTESELTVASASGLSRWGMLTPALRLAMLAGAAHLAIMLWAQPFSYREMRRTLYDAQADLAATLLKPGEFVKASDDLTLYLQDVQPGGQLTGLMIEDARNPEQPVIYMAKKGKMVQSAVSPSIILQEGSIQQVEDDGGLSFLDFETYPFDLTRFVEPQGELIYKLSDRYLFELLFPDPSDHWESANRTEMLAEGHSRLTTPLHDIAVALIAVLALIGGDFSRIGYSRRIWLASGAALAVRLLGFAAQSAANDDPWMNILQYAVPVMGGGIALFMLLNPKRRAPRRRIRRARLEGAPA